MSKINDTYYSSVSSPAKIKKIGIEERVSQKIKWRVKKERVR